MPVSTVRRVMPVSTVRRGMPVREIMPVSTVRRVMLGSTVRKVMPVKSRKEGNASKHGRHYRHYPPYCMGAGSGGAQAPPVFWTGGGGGHSSKIMLSEVHQLLHITLTIPELRLPLQNEHFLPFIVYNDTKLF